MARDGHLGVWVLQLVGRKASRMTKVDVALHGLTRFQFLIDFYTYAADEIPNVQVLGIFNDFIKSPK